MSSLPARAPQKNGQPPCKTIVTGLEGQDPADTAALARKLSGVISRFYNSSRQNSDNSAGDVWHAHQRLPGELGVLHYASNQGMETMRIELNPQVVPEVIEELKRVPYKPPVAQFCVVDFVLPGGDTIRQADFIAVCVLPERWAGEWDTDSVAWTDESEDPNISNTEKLWPHRFARDGGPIAFEAAITNRVASLKFDMRDYDEAAKFEVEMYGRVRPKEFEIIGYGDTTYTRTLVYDDRGTGDRGLGMEMARIDWTFYDSNGGSHRPGHTVPLGHGSIFSNGGQIGDGRYPASEAFAIEWGVDKGYQYEYDPASGLIIKEVIYHFWEGSYENTFVGRVCPIHNIRVGSRQNYDFITKNERRWEVTAKPGVPQRSDTFEAQADIVYAFYDDPEISWKVGRTEHQDVRYGGPNGEITSWPSIWSKDLQIPTERKLLPAKAPMQWTTVPGNPSDYGKMGTLTVDRASRTVTFVPG